jgi:hypothetical protein
VRVLLRLDAARDFTALQEQETPGQCKQSEAEQGR